MFAVRPPFGVEPPPSVLTLRIAVCEALRGIDDVIAVGEITTIGRPGNTVLLRQGNRYLAVTTQDGLRTVRGFDGTTRWHSTQAGSIAIDANSDDGESSGETFSVERAIAPLDAYILVRRRDDRIVRRQTIDRVTGDLVEDEHDDPSGRSVDFYGDFQHLGDRELPWRRVSSDPDGVLAYETIGAVARDSVEPELFAAPSSRRLATFPGEKHCVDLPRHERDGHPTLGATVDDRHVEFGLDVAAAESVIDRTTARALGLRSVRTVRESHGSYASDLRAIVAGIRLGGLVIRDVMVKIVDTAPKRTTHASPAFAILGGDTLGGLRLIDRRTSGVVTICSVDG